MLNKLKYIYENNYLKIRYDNEHLLLEMAEYNKEPFIFEIAV